jgi:hypothetical protein
MTMSVLAAGPALAQPRAAITTDQKQSRYQIGVMERVLEGAVEHGVTMTRDRLQAVLPAEIQLVSENARVRGFRLENYGVFFDVVVPSFEGTLPWIFRTLDRNDLALDRALKALKTHIAAAGDVELEQALKRVELQVGPLPASNAAVPRVAAGSAPAAAAKVDVPIEQPGDAILNDPQEAYRGEVKQALMDAMLDHSSSLSISGSEWLTVAARRSDDRPRLAPADSDAGTMVIRVRGNDLAAFLARQIPREEALKRIEVRVF